MACKSHLRCGRPVLLALASNDSLAASAPNLGRLLNTKNYYFVPMAQDDWLKKPTSLVADFDQLPDAVELALRGKQIQPIFFEKSRLSKMRRSGTLIKIRRRNRKRPGALRPVFS